MAITQLYTAVAGDVITAARWNNEFGNLYNNLANPTNAYRVKNLKDDYAAVGDGVSNDQTAVASAVAAAYASGFDLYWPDGSYLTTATIPNFHDVQHRGPGVLTRGATTFYVDPSFHSGDSRTNNLYVATTGVDTADGLTSAQPRLTALSMGNVIYGYQWADITWAVNIAAGTYTAVSQSFSKPFPSPNRVQFLGVFVGAGVQPTTIMVATGHGVGTAVQGFYFQNSVRVQVSDIDFRNYRTAGSPDADALGSGIVVDGRCELYTTNVWTNDCDAGIYITNGSHARIQAGRHGFTTVNGAGIHFIRHSHGTVGYAGTLADVNGVTGVAFIGGQRGLIINEFSMVHADFCYFSAQTLSGVLLQTSRVHSVSSTYNTCVVGIDGRMNSNIGTTSNTFTANTNDIFSRSGSVSAGTNSAIEATSFNAPMSERDTSSFTTTSGTPVTFYTKSFAAGEFFNRGTGFKLTVWGEVVGITNTKVLTFTLGGTTLLTATIAAATTDYKIEIEVTNRTAASSQKLFTSIHQNGTLPVHVLNISMAEDLTVATTLTATHLVTGGASDTSRIGNTLLEMVH